MEPIAVSMVKEAFLCELSSFNALLDTDSCTVSAVFESTWIEIAGAVSVVCAACRTVWTDLLRVSAETCAV